MSTSQSINTESTLTIQQTQGQTLQTDALNVANNLPWGLISILAIMLIVGLVIFKRKTPLLSRSNDNNNNNTDINAKLSVVKLNPKELQASLNQPTNKQAPEITFDDPNQINNTNYRMADGVEAKYFLRQARGIFLHLHQLNNNQNMVEIAKYLAPDLYPIIKQKLTLPSEYNDLNCSLLNTILNADNSLMAEVKFSNNSSNLSNKTATNSFSQIWRFVKPDNHIHSKWLVTAIQ